MKFLNKKTEEIPLKMLNAGGVPFTPLIPLWRPANKESNPCGETSVYSEMERLHSVASSGRSAPLRSHAFRSPGSLHVIRVVEHRISGYGLSTASPKCR